MGAQESKVDQPANKEENTIKETTLSESVPSTPILTPSDPRSPSVNIARTPLEVILGSKTTQDSGGEQEDDCIETKDVVNVVLGIDPRSPTVEFNRTPIIVATVAKQKKLLNKNLDNVLKSEILTTPVTATKNSPNIVPPKLLDSSPISVAISSKNKRKSFVGLLETNIDYTETDLDSVSQPQDTLNQSLPVELNDDLPCNKLKSQMQILHSEIENMQMTPEDLEFVEKDAELLTKAIEDKVMNVTVHVKDFDKKLTNLIYEDASDDETKSNKITTIKENNRTPLSVINLNEDTQKPKNRLKVSDKPRKSELSKIPVFKKNSVQCENTPPMEASQHKSKISHWDADKTLII